MIGTRKLLVWYLLLLLPINIASAGSGLGPDKPAAAPRVFLLDGKHLLAARVRIGSRDKSLEPALARLRRDAQKALSTEPQSVVSKQATPPSGSKHDYLSQAPYFWPNPKTPDHLPYIRRDGERNPEINMISDHQTMDRMVSAVETLALAYFFDGDGACAAKAAELVRAWFVDSATRMNPNLEFAQFIPGVNTGRGIGLIETRGLQCGKPRRIDVAGNTGR